MSCLTEDAVTDFVAGEMNTERAADVDRHMAECDACRSLVADVAQMAFGDDAASHDGGRPRTPGVGDVVGRYRLVEIVGVGGMGVVYAAEDPELERRIALKLIRADLAKTSGIELTRRLHHEARAMAKISHPNVVTVYDIGTIGDHLFVAMEYVHGMTLRAWRGASRRAWTEVLDAFIAAGRGLVAAHAVGLVHRDFKPENVLYGEDGRVRVTDFGLARGHLQPSDELAARESTPLVKAQVASPTLTTRTGQLVGTPAYMAPEQLSGSPADVRSDQFSFSVALFEALYSVRPYTAKDVAELAVKLAQGHVALPPDETDVPPALYPILTRALRSNPEDRFPSVQALLDELAAFRPKASERYASRLKPVVVPSPPSPPRPIPATNAKGRVAIASVVVVVSIVGAGVWLATPKRAGHSPERTFPRPAGGGECIRGNGLYCDGHGVNGEPGRLYRCAESTISVEKSCNVACLHLGRGAGDACDGDTTECPFNGSGVYCGYNYLSADPKTLYRCAAGKVTVAQRCPTKCVEEPDHVADHCD